MKRQPDNQDVYDGYEKMSGNGNVYPQKDPVVGAIVKGLAALGATVVAAAIGFAYGRIFDHESRISGLEAVEKYKEQEKKAIYSGVASNGRP